MALRSPIDRYDWLDALEDFVLDSDGCVEAMCEFLLDDSEAVDLEAFLEARYPDVLKGFKEQYERKT